MPGLDAQLFNAKKVSTALPDFIANLTLMMMKVTGVSCVSVPRILSDMCMTCDETVCLHACKHELWLLGTAFCKKSNVHAARLVLGLPKLLRRGNCPCSAFFSFVACLLASDITLFARGCSQPLAPLTVSMPQCCNSFAGCLAVVSVYVKLGLLLCLGVALFLCACSQKSDAFSRLDGSWCKMSHTGQPIAACSSCQDSGKVCKLTWSA